jgi:hypothetical protein
MTKALLLAVSLACCSMWAIAQTSPDQNGHSEKGKSGTTQTTIQGCLMNSGETYTITDSAGKEYQLTGNTESLSSHVHQQIKVKGMVAGTQGTGSATTAGSGEAFQVSKVTKISDSCK